MNTKQIYKRQYNFHTYYTKGEAIGFISNFSSACFPEMLL